MTEISEKMCEVWDLWDRNPHDLGWLAGLFEGEGHIGIHRSGTSYVLRCAVAMTDSEVVSWFHERWPGHLRERKYPDLRLNARTQTKWEVQARKAERFLLDIGPYFRTARVKEKAQVGLEFQAQKLNTAAGRWAPREYHDLQRVYHERFHRLNATGRG